MLRQHQEHLVRLERRRAMRRERAATLMAETPPPLATLQPPIAEPTPPEPTPPEPTTAVAEPTAPTPTPLEPLAANELTEPQTPTEPLAATLTSSSSLGSSELRQPEPAKDGIVRDSSDPSCAEFDNLDDQQLAAILREYHGDELIFDAIEVPQDVASRIDGYYAQLSPGT